MFCVAGSGKLLVHNIERLARSFWQPGSCISCVTREKRTSIIVLGTGVALQRREVALSISTISERGANDKAEIEFRPT